MEIYATAPKVQELKDEDADTYPKRNPMEVYKSKFSFLLVGMGMSMCWYSISAAIPYWTDAYGKDMYRYLLISYNGASLMVVVLQMWDDKCNYRYGTAFTYAFRTFSAGTILLVCEVTLPLLPHNINYVLIVVVIAGVFDSVGFGAVTQLSSLYPAGTSSYMFVGQSFCSIFLLLLTVGLKFGSEPTTEQLYRFFFGSAIMIILCAICGFIYLASLGLYHHVCDYKEQYFGYTRLLDETGLAAKKQTGQNSPTKQSLSINNDQTSCVSSSLGCRNGSNLCILPPSDSIVHFHSDSTFLIKSWSSSTKLTGAEPSPTKLLDDIKAVFTQTKGLQMNIILCWFSTMLVQSMFAHVPSTNDNSLLSQILVYVNLFATFFGQQLNLLISKPFHTFKNITIALWVRAFSLIFFFLYLSQLLDFLNDYVVISYTILFFISGGFFTLQLYGMIAEAVPVSSRTMAICITNISLLLGIVSGILATLAVSSALDNS